MTDSLADSRLKQAVVWRDDKPLLELTAEEFIYPVTTQDDAFKVYVHLSPYLSHEVQSFFDAFIPRSKRRTSSEMVIETSDLSPAADFVADHFLQFSGIADASIEDQRQWLQDNREFAIRAFREGVNAVAPRDPNATGAMSTKPVLLLGRQDYHIKSEVNLYSRETKADVRIPITHHIARMSESDRRQYDKAIKVIENSRLGEVHIEANWDVIIGRYNALVKSIDGALVDGEPCTEANKEAWVKLVPWCLKRYAISEAFTAVALGNG